MLKRTSCGRKHAMALDSEGHIWVFRSWGRPFRLVTPLLDNSSPEKKIVQIECTFSFYCCVLTESGDTYVFSPFLGTMANLYYDQMQRMDEAEEMRAKTPGESVIRCDTWDLICDPFLLPHPTTDLPDLRRGHKTAPESDELKIRKIAALSHCLVALTNHGHVLKIALVRNHEISWEYVSPPNSYSFRC